MNFKLILMKILYLGTLKCQMSTPATGTSNNYARKSENMQMLTAIGCFNNFWQKALKSNPLESHISFMSFLLLLLLCVYAPSCNSMYK